MFQILMIRKSRFWAGSFTWNAAKGAAVEGVGAKICEIQEIGVGGSTLQNSICGFRPYFVKQKSIEKQKLQNP